MSVAKNMPSYYQRIQHGVEFPELQTVAMRVLAMVHRARACKRNWSSYNFIRSKKRNRSTPKRADDIVYVCTNMRLGKRSRAFESFGTRK